MRQPDSAWRDRYYASALEKILAMSLEIENHQLMISPFARPWPDIRAFAAGKAKEPTQDSSIPNASDATAAFMDSSPSTLSSGSRDSFFWTNSEVSSMVTPTTATSSFSSSLVSPSTPVDKMKCPFCPATFAPLYGKANLQRHLRSASVHGNGTAFVCPELGCSSILRSTRKDHLKIHHQRKHQMTALVPQRSHTKRRRDLDKVIERRSRSFGSDGSDLLEQGWAMHA